MMPALPLVSVVIPCYEQRRFLPDAISSARSQAYPNLEVIVVDDGSTDGSGEAAGALGVQVIHQTNKGLGSARNVGLAAAKGDLVIFLDADDELLPEAVSTGVAQLAADAHASCVVRRCQLMDAERRSLPANYPPLGTTDLYREWLRHNFVWTPGAAIFRRQRLAAIGGFPVDIGPAADYAVYLTLARTNEVRYHAKDVVRYRQHDSNMSRDPLLMLHATLGVLRRERPNVREDYIADYRAGVVNWRAYYGEQIIERLRRERRAGVRSDWQKRAIVALMNDCPRVMLKHAWRKMSRVARGVAPAPIESGRFHRGIPSRSPAARPR